MISNIRKVTANDNNILNFTDNLVICISTDSGYSEIPNKIHEDS